MGNVPRTCNEMTNHVEGDVQQQNYDPGKTLKVCNNKAMTRKVCNNEMRTGKKRYAATTHWCKIFKHSLITLCQNLCSSLLSTENVRIFVVLYFFYFSLLVIPSHPSWILTQYNSPRWNGTQTREANLEKYFPKRYFSILLNQNENPGEGWRWSLSLS